MSIQSTYRSLFILIFSCCSLLISLKAFAQSDTAAKDTVSEKNIKKPDLAGHQLCIGLDFFHPVENLFLTDRYAYEIAADYYSRNGYYIVAEGGWGGASINYPDLSYKTTNNFLRFGFNKSVLTRDRPTDWDMMLIGLRLAGAYINRSPATYTVIDSLWGSVPGTQGGTAFTAVWAELTGGVRVELAKGIGLGWNIRGKFMLNGKSFNSLSPLYIAGYGRGDKNTVFDFNMYVSYALRWKRKSATVVDKASPGKK